MTVKRLLLLTALSLAIVGYLIYEPIPDGYSTVSAIKLQLLFATFKVSGIVVCFAMRLLFCS